MNNATDLMIRDVFLLKQMEEVTDQLQSATARAMEQEIRDRFGLLGPKDIKTTKAKPFAQVYTRAMAVSFLYGMLHVQNLEKDQIALSDKAFKVNFAEAEEALASLVDMPRKEYEDLEAGLKFRAFTIARVSQDDVVRKVKQAYQAHMEQGRSRHELLQEMDGILERAGVSSNNPRWLETHYRNNTMSAYNAGRWTQLQKSDTSQFLMYNAIMDGSTTELCKKLHGRVLPKDHAFWKKFHPPNHHNCRSLITPVSKGQVRARGLKVENMTSKQFYEEDPDLKDVVEQEHQFRAHPLGSWDVIPESMARRAEKSGLWCDIFRMYKQSLSKKYWERKKAWLAKLQPSKGMMEHINGSAHTRGIGREAVMETIRTPDETYLAGTKTGKGLEKSYRLVRWTGSEKGLMVCVREKVRTAYPITKQQLKDLVGKYGLVRL
jgi:SPP1 gp7 family putative phage head morphogenesis protein